jgi:hypothetical protein
MLTRPAVFYYADAVLIMLLSNDLGDWIYLGGPDRIRFSFCSKDPL